MSKMDVEVNENNTGNNGIPTDEEVLKMRPEFVNQDAVNELYLCDMCHLVVIHPMQTACGHRFCLDCITSLFKTAEKETGSPKIHCPAGTVDCLDLVPADNTDEPDCAIFEDLGAENDLHEMDAFCVFKPEGCKQQFKYSVLGSHCLECNYRPAPCFSCNNRVLLGHSDEHAKTECPMRMVPCEYCGKQFKAAELVKHQRTECPNHLVNCPNDCGTPAMAEAKLEEHLKECKKMEGYCMFKEFGCEFNARGMETDDQQVTVDETKLTAHENANDGADFAKHLRILVSTLRQLRLDNINLVTQLREMQQRNLTQKSQMDSLMHTVDDLKLSFEVQKTTIERLQSAEARPPAVSVQVGGGGVGMGDSRVSQVTTSLDDLNRRLQDLEQQRNSTYNPYQSALGSAPTSHLPTSSMAYGSSGTMVAGSGAQMMKVEEDLLQHTQKIADMDQRVQTLETLSTNGVLIWKLDKWGQKLSESKAGRNLSLDSPSFYTSKYGYHMKARVYPNGDGAGRNTHVSLFFVLCRGHFDELLPWPFKQKVTFMILDQESGTRHICDTFRPDPQSQSFKKPTTDMNLASGCPLFVSHELLTVSQRRYVSNDTLYVKVAVDTSDLFLP